MKLSNKVYQKAFSTLNKNGVNYDRNGVSGKGFWKTLLTVDEATVVVTFETTEFDENNQRDFLVDYETCRVVNPFNLNWDYRGDRLSEKVQQKVDGILASIKDVFTEKETV